MRVVPFLDEAETEELLDVFAHCRDAHPQHRLLCQLLGFLVPPAPGSEIRNLEPPYQCPRPLLLEVGVEVSRTFLPVDHLLQHHGGLERTGEFDELFLDDAAL